MITSFTFAQNKIISVDAKANISLLNGSISEYVFTPASHNTDDVLSRLDWDVKNVPIVSASVDLTLFKYAYFNLGAGFGFPSTSSGNMQDYDWLNCIPKNGVPCGATFISISIFKFFPLGIMLMSVFTSSAA